MTAKPKRSPTALEYAILGLAAAGPQTGYEICRLFEETPIAAYSSSPGSIYPAIKRLRAAGLIGEAPHPENPEGSKKALTATSEGRAVLRAWLTAPITREDVEHRMSEQMLRFAFMSGNITPPAIARFLKRMKTEIEAHVTHLEDYAAQMSAHMPLTGALALRAGIDGYKDRARWAALALKKIEAEVAGSQRRKRKGAGS